MKKILKKENAITLVALVITIIILLILAGITISQLSNNGLFGKSQEAKEKWANEQEKENIILADYSEQIDTITGDRGSKINYSTEEQDTGLKWIDGRTIYQKTWSGLSVEVPYNSWVDVVSVPNIDLLINCSAMTSYGLNINGAGIEFTPQNGKIKSEYNVNINRRVIAYFTAQYVKTDNNTN